VALYKKMLVIVSLTMIGIIVLSFVISQTVLLNSYIELEQQQTRENLDRALRSLSDELSGLNSTAHDWSSWDDTYAFVKDRNPDFVQLNLADATFVNLRINLMLFANLTGAVVYAKAFDLENNREMPVPGSLKDQLSPDNPLLHKSWLPEIGVTGIALLPEGPVLIVSSPILTSEGQGPARGTFIIGRYLDSTEVKRLATTTGLSIDVRRSDDSNMAPDFEVARSSLSEKNPTFVRPLDSETVAGYALLNDVLDRPVLILRIDAPREIYMQGQATASHLVLALVVSGLAFGAVTMLLLERYVLSPVRRLSVDINKIAQSGDLSARVSMKETRDELSGLVDRINAMLQAIAQAQNGLQASEEKFRRIAENTVDVIFELDLDGTIRYDSPASERIFGYKPEEVIGRSAEFLFSDSELPKMYDSLAVIANGENVERLETEMLRKDGSQISVEISGSPILRGERIVGALGILRDVTERKQMEDAIRNSETKYRTLFEKMPQGIYQTSLEGKLMIANPALVQLLGYESERDLLAANIERDLYVNPEDRKTWMERIRTRGEVRGAEMVLKRKDGEEVTVLDNAHVVHDEHAKPVYYEGTLTDITGRKLMEEVLRESEDRYRTLFDSTNDAIFIHDMGGKFLEVNQVGCERLRYSREEFLQMTPADIDSPEYAATAPQRIEELRKVGHSLSEIAQASRDGTIIPTELSSRIIDYKGKPAVLSIARDITERKQMERIKDQFISTVSHELRTPLTSIRASLGLLASGVSGALPEKGQRMLEIAVTNTDRLVRLINDILDSERLTSGKTPMEKKQCSAAQLVTQAADVMKPMAEKAGITLSVESQDAALWADPDRIAQALTNLVGNAIKFSPKGGRIWVTAERKENQMVFEVRDEGRGIPPNKLGLLFERFQQVDASDAREKGGTGLGLSISKSIVEQHNGRIWVESTVGKGSTFFFTLPLPQETEAPVQPEATTEAQSTRVLIIEDDPDLANILATMLQRHDTQSRIAHTAGKGITLSKQMRPDMIVLDLGLPDMDGSAVVQALREDNILRLVPLVVYTVRELNEQQRENLRLGETLFFTKSRVPPDQFEEKVTQFMKRILENRGKTSVS